MHSSPPFGCGPSGRTTSRVWARRLANVDHQTRFALVLERETPSGPELIGAARYEPSSEPGVAEVAFVVQDEYQGKGLGRLLLDELLATAEAHGIFERRA